jgi:hypothetical protein
VHDSHPCCFYGDLEDPIGLESRDGKNMSAPQSAQTLKRLAQDVFWEMLKGVSDFFMGATEWLNAIAPDAASGQ